MSNFIKREWLLLLILFSSLVFAVVIYSYMPDQVPIHWNIEGEIDNYGSKAFGTFFIPLLNIGMYILFLVLPKLDPKKESYKEFERSYTIIRYSMHIFMTVLFLVTVFASLGYNVDVSLWIAAGVAVLFIVMGSVMGKVKHNYFVGFKFPWTLANEEVWKKTHYVGSKAMVWGGILAIIGVILTEGTARFIILMVGIFVPTILTTVYSYLYFKKITNGSNK